LENVVDTESAPTNLPPLKVEPDNIDFGCLRPGESKSTTLRISGGPGIVVAHNDQLEIVPSNFSSEDTELQVSLSGGSAGELIWDTIVLKGNKEELSVLVTGRWEEQRMLSQVAIVTKEETKPLPSAPAERKFKGRKCNRCGKNFKYDENSHSWEQCHCGPHQVIINTSRHIITELRLNINYLALAAKGTWNVMLGREKW